MTNNIRHIAIIMDGNRRWAKERNLPSAAGHKKGVDALRNVVRACDDIGIKYLTVYAFSTENWNRKKEEVDFLMDLVAVTLKNDLDEMHEEGVKITFIGDASKLSKKLQEVTKDAENKTKNNKGVNLQIALNYGSRDEIVNAVKQIIGSGINSDEVTQEVISKYLYTAGMPDPDILIRTGGEKRLSNYLLWQIAYSEVIVVDKYWPDFGKSDLQNCIDEFNNRNRRYGK
jgi:undecaprenyl diphosphate synthase